MFEMKKEITGETFKTSDIQELFHAYLKFLEDEDSFGGRILFKIDNSSWMSWNDLRTTTEF